jgi:hypothetical protein
MPYTTSMPGLPEENDAVPYAGGAAPPMDSVPAPPSGPNRLVREAHFLNRAARPDKNLMIVQEFETAAGERYTRTIYRAWKGL